jgi:hypothetical protein
MPTSRRLTRLIALCAALILSDPASPTHAQVATSEPKLGIGGISGSGWMILSPQTQRQLRDPEQRKLLRQEERGRIQGANPDVVRVLALPPALGEELIDLLTDQKMTELDRSISPDPERNSTQANIQQERGNLQGVRRLLGEAVFQDYLDFQDSLAQRQQVRNLAKQLIASDALSFEQQEGLVQVLIEERDRQRERNWLGLESVELPQSTARGDQSDMRQASVIALEAQIRQAQRLDSAILVRLPALLHARQIEAFAALQAQPLATLRTQVQQAREQAGIGTLQVQYPPAPPALVGPMRLNVQLEINGQRAAPLALEVEHGKPVSFDAPGGLAGEAIGFFFEGEYMVVRFRFFERTPKGRRLVFEYPGWGYSGREQASVMKWGSSSSMASFGALPLTASINYNAERL